MPNTKISFGVDGKDLTRDELGVTIRSERIADTEDGGAYLHIQFTDEGIIADLWNEDGTEVLRSMSMMYDEFIDGMLT